MEATPDRNAGVSGAGVEGLTPPLVLSLFPGIGLLDMAFEEAGFCVVRGPDLLWGGDIKRFHPPAGKFDGVTGGPPCQAWSRLSFLSRSNGYAIKPDLIPEFSRCVSECRPTWFLMENVEDAPLPVTASDYYVTKSLLRDVWVGGCTNRLRQFVFGRINGSSLAMRLPLDVVALHRQPEPSAVASNGGKYADGRIAGPERKRLGLKTMRIPLSTQLRKQGLPDDFLADAPFTAEGKHRIIGNGVPLPMGRAVARAVKRAMYPDWKVEADLTTD